MTKPRNYQTEAIIIKKTKLGEADRILTLLTFEREDKNGESKRGEASLKNPLPLSLKGEGDTGGEVQL